MSKIEPGMPGSPLPVLGIFVRDVSEPAHARDFESALKVSPVEQSTAVGDPLSGQPTSLETPMADSLVQTLRKHYGAQENGFDQDRDSFQAFIREQLPLRKQRETALFEMLSALGGCPQDGYLKQLVNSELRHLIPVNGILDNLLRNSHKLDLES